jgi:hypothetical protein
MVVEDVEGSRKVDSAIAGKEAAGDLAFGFHP